MSAIAFLQSRNITGVTYSPDKVILPVKTSPKSIGLGILAKKTDHNALRIASIVFAKSNATILSLTKQDGREVFVDQAGRKYIFVNHKEAGTRMKKDYKAFLQSAATTSASSSSSSSSAASTTPAASSSSTTTTTPETNSTSADDATKQPAKGCCISQFFSRIWDCVIKAFQALFCCCKATPKPKSFIDKDGVEVTLPKGVTKEEYLKLESTKPSGLA